MQKILKVYYHGAFTLIELSIVLVIIGLIVGGVLVGRDLIQSAQTRAQISQVEELKTAVNTFKLKYNCIPGDCPTAAQFGFVYDASYIANNGDSQIFCNPNYGMNFQQTREIFNFYAHLSEAGLIPGDYPGWDASMNIATPFASLDGYVPPAKIIKGVITPCTMKYNYGLGSDILLGNAFGIYTYGVVGGASRLFPAMRASQAYNIDSKIDDGLPATGSVVPLSLNAGDMPLGTAQAIGCTGTASDVTANQYDVAGRLNLVWVAGPGYVNATPDPYPIECAIAVGKAW